MERDKVAEKESAFAQVARKANALALEEVSLSPMRLQGLLLSPGALPTSARC